jgi:hypothetical protein
MYDGRNKSQYAQHQYGEYLYGGILGKEHFIKYKYVKSQTEQLMIAYDRKQTWM